MTLTITASKLTGIPGASGWAQIHEFKPEDAEKLKLRGHLVAVVATKKEEGGNSVLVGRELLTRFHEEYFGKEEGTAFNVLKGAIEKVIDEFKEKEGRIEIVAAAVVGDVVYTAVGGGGKVAVVRDGMVANILEGRGEEVAVASGYPKEGDMLLLGTTSFFETFPPEAIKAGLSQENRGSVEYFAPMIHAKVASGDIGVAIIGFKKEPDILTSPEEKGSLSFLKNFASNLSDVVSGLTRAIPERKIYVRGIPQEETTLAQGKRTTLTAGIILLVLLLVSIGFGIKAKRDKESKSRYLATLTAAQHELSEAEGLFGLNPDRARELLADSRDKVNGLLAQKISDPDLASLAGKIKEDEGKILGEYKEEPQTFIDLSLLSSGFNGDTLSASSEKIYVLDKGGKKIISVAFATKRSEVVAGPDEVGNALAMAAYGDRVFALSETGVYEVTGTKKKVIDKDWSGEAWPYAYTGNIYLLDKGANMIWRYQGGGGDFGPKQKWLGHGVTPDFSNAVSWTIDGSVWIINGNGQIAKFTLGREDAFAPSGVAPDLESATAIYTNENLKYIYILEAKKSRVVVLSKDGKFAAQYLSDKIGNAKSLVVSESEKKIVLLEGNKLYSIELKHL